MQASEDVKLVINGLNGTICEVEAKATWAVRDVKAAIEASVQIQKQQQRLLCGSSELLDGQAISSLPVGDLMHLTLVLRPSEQAHWLGAVERDWSELLSAPAAVWADQDVVAAAVAQCGIALKHAAPELQANRIVVLAAVRQNGLALRYVAPHLAADTEIALLATAKCGRALDFVAPELREDRRFILEVVQQNGRTLEYAGRQFRSDREVVLSAVKQCGTALAGAAHSLRADYEVVTAAVTKDPAALAFAAYSLRKDPEVEALVQATRALVSSTGVDRSLERSPEVKALGTYFFGDGHSDGNLGMSRLLGKQGALMCEMANLGLPVTPGFCVTSKRSDTKDASHLKKMVNEALAKVEQTTGQSLGSPTRPLLLSVHCDSMPSTPRGLTVSNIGLNDAIVEAGQWCDNPRFVWDSYRRLISAFAEVVKHLDPKPFQTELAAVKHRLNCRCRLGRQHDDGDIPTEELKQLVGKYKAIYEQQVGEGFPQDPQIQLSQALLALLHGPQASQRGVGTAFVGSQHAVAVVQAMVFGNYDSQSASGVAFAECGESGVSNLDGRWLVNAQHEDVVGGQRTMLHLTTEASRTWAAHHGIAEDERSWHYPSLEEYMPAAYSKLLHCQDVLSQHMDTAQNVGFMVQQGDLWVSVPSFSDKWFEPWRSDGNLSGASLLGDEGKRDVEIQVGAVKTFIDRSSTEAARTPGATCDTEASTPSHLKTFERPVVQDAHADGFALWVEGAAAAAVPPTFASNLVPMPKVAHEACARPMVCLLQGSCSPRGRAPRPRPPRPRRQRPSAAPSREVGKPQGHECAGRPWSLQVPALKLPLWQTALAGGAAGVASQIAAGNFAAWSRAVPTGAVCCTCYVNLLSVASRDSNLDNVAAPLRLACAASAASIAISLTSTAATASSWLPGRSSLSNTGVRATVGAGVGWSKLSVGLRSTLARSVPVTAVEMCSIDVVKNAATASGYTVTPGLLIAAGGTAGFISQTLLYSAGALPSQGPAAVRTSRSLVLSRAAGQDFVGFGRLEPLLRDLGPAYRRSVPGVAANALVRVGLVTHFMAAQE